MRHYVTMHDSAELCRRTLLAATIAEARGLTETARILYDAVDAFALDVQLHAPWQTSAHATSSGANGAPLDDGEPATRLSVR